MTNARAPRYIPNTLSPHISPWGAAIMSFLRKFFGLAAREPGNRGRKSSSRRARRRGFETLERRDLLAVNIIDDGDLGFSTLLP